MNAGSRREGFAIIFIYLSALSAATDFMVVVLNINLILKKKKPQQDDDDLDFDDE